MRKRTTSHSRSKPTGKLAVTYRHVEQLRLDPKNPRCHSRRQIEQIAESIKAFGFNVPVLIDGHEGVIAGHGRVQAARALGLAEVPTVTLSHLSGPQLRAFMVADNKLTENSTWDDHLLAEQLKMLSEVDLSFTLEATGFEMGEIDVMIDGLEADGDDVQDGADELPDESAVPVTRPGSLWCLGPHRVLCGDALKSESYEQLMNGQRAAAVLADNPYNDPIDGYVTGFGKIHHDEFAMASGEMTSPEFTKFLNTVFSHLAANSDDGSLHYLFMDWRHAKELLAAAEPVYSEFKNLCVWVKDAGGQGSFYRSQHELVFVFKSGKGKHRNNFLLGQYGRYRTNVWSYSRVNSLGKSGDEEGLGSVHPTMKPVAMVADAIMDCTTRRGIVLDPFLGSGTTVIAAERTGRACYGMELDPRYVDITVRRWQQFTHKHAVLSSSGKTFNELERKGRRNG